MSNNKQQTAVEQFAIELYDNGFLTGNGDEIQELLEKAKDIEKEQIIEAFEKGVIAEFTHQVTGAPETSGDEYYNETYGHGLQ